MKQPVWKLDWKDETSIRLWIRGVSSALRSTAGMLKGLADSMDDAMPPPPEGAAEKEVPDYSGLRMCVHCGKTDEEVRLAAPFGAAAGSAVSICENCVRLAVSKMAEASDKPAG